MTEIGYPLGGLNWNGDTPIILSVDACDLGGLLVSTTLVSAEWRVGQLAPGMMVKWTPISFSQARLLHQRIEDFLSDVARGRKGSMDIKDIKPLSMEIEEIGSYNEAPGPILHHEPANQGRAEVNIRAAGDRNVLLEIGQMTADIVNRCHLELLLRKLNEVKKPGVLYCDPNIRSITVRFDPKMIAQNEVVDFLCEVEKDIPDASNTKIDSREWSLPVCLNHPDVGASVDRYRSMTRDKAIWLEDKPGTDNKAYIARANGLSSIKEVEDAILQSSMLTVANGFWLGTPILMPQDQRKRLKCMKYNPTRLQTPEGTLGLGGSMGAIYGVESAGGYQLIGRTLPGWSTYGTLPGFTPDRPWLFEPFDVLSFYPVDAETYDGMLAKFKAGRWQWQMKKTVYDVAEQVRFEKSIEKEVAEFREKQKKALLKVEAEEMELFKQWTDEKEEKGKVKGAGGKGNSDWDWESGKSTRRDVETRRSLFRPFSDVLADPEAILIKAEMSGVIWKTVTEMGKAFKKGEAVTILEAMKMEIPCNASSNFKVKAIVKLPGERVDGGQVVVAGVAC